MADLAKFKEEQGFNPDFDSLKECIEVGKKAVDWNRKYHLPGRKILPNGNYHGWDSSRPWHGVICRGRSA